MELLSIEERIIVYYCMLACSILSLLGSAFICFIFLVCKNLHQYSFRMIFVLSIFDIGSSAAFCIPAYDSEGSSAECQVQAIILSFFSLSGALWTLYIASSLYAIIVKNSMFFEKYFNHALVSIIVLSFITTIIPVITNSYGKVAGWCWIPSKGLNTGFYERILLFFIPLWLIILFNLFLYIIILRRLSTNLVDQNIIDSLSRKLVYYPLISIICFLPYTLKAILETLEVPFVYQFDFQFTLVSGISRSIIGFLNAIVYGNTRIIKKTIKQRLSGDGFIVKNLENCPAKRNRLNTIQGSQCTVFSGTFGTDEFD